MDRLDELAIFVGIIEAGSLAGAARRLRRSPPAVTRALNALEDRVGVRLVERTTRRLAPTEAGTLLAERARIVLSDYDSAVLGVSSTVVAGTLRVTAPVQFGRRHISPIVADFLNEYPDVRAELILADRNLDLIEERLDVAVRIGHLKDSALIARQVGSVNRVTVASPAYLARRGLPLKPADLAGHDVIFGMARSTEREWRFGSGSRGTVVRLSSRLLVDDVEARLQAVRAGRGIARALSYQVIEEVASGALVRLLSEHEPEPLPVQLVTPSRSHLAPRVRAFLDYAAQALRGLDVIRPEKA